MLKESYQPNSQEITGQTHKEHLFCSMSLESWKEWVTKQRQEFSVRVKSGHLIKGKESLSWGSPRATEAKDCGDVGSPSHIHMMKKGYLSAQAKQWLTPATIQIQRKDFQKREEYRKSIGRQYVPGSLEEQMQMYPTPTTMEAEKSGQYAKGQMGQSLSAMANRGELNWPTPISGDSHLSSTPQAAAKRLAEGKVTLSRLVESNNQHPTHQDQDNHNMNGNRQESWATPTMMDSSKDGDMTASAKMLLGATHRASGQAIQKTLTDKVHMEILQANPEMAMELANRPMLKRTKLPPQQDFVKWIRQTNAKDLAEKTNLQLTKVEHWFRKDNKGFAHPSIEDWEIIKTHLKDWEKWDNQMTYQESIDWQGETEKKWATPIAGDWKGQVRSKGEPTMLSGVVEKQWRTPTAQEAGAKVETLYTKDGQPAKIGERAYRKTPKGEMVLQSQTINQQVEMESPQPQSMKLNPRWVETLMGLPVGWVMASCVRPWKVELMN
jgi:hypothetical protein